MRGGFGGFRGFVPAHSRKESKSFKKFYTSSLAWVVTNPLNPPIRAHLSADSDIRWAVSEPSADQVRNTASECCCGHDHAAPSHSPLERGLGADLGSDDLGISKSGPPDWRKLAATPKHKSLPCCELTAGELE